MYLYSGHPREALQCYADAFRRCLPAEVKTIGAEMIAVGVRSVQGHACDLDRFYAFLRYGPDGPDGIPGTDDDLKDPFAELGITVRQPADDGGLAGITPDQRKLLLELRGHLEQIAFFERDEPYVRKDALADLARVHAALCDWGTAQQKQWFIDLMFAGRADQVRLEACDCARLPRAAATFTWRGSRPSGAISTPWCNPAAQPSVQLSSRATTSSRPCGTLRNPARSSPSFSR